MLSFNSTVGALVVWWDEGYFYAQDSLEIKPEAGLVRKTIVTDDLLRTPVPL